MVELADIFRVHGPAYRAQYAQHMLPSHRRAMRDIEQCRTPALGGSLYGCVDHPEVLLYSYHSCGNRTCPKCGNDDTNAWLEKQRGLLLPVDYFLVTFTLPAECREVARSHQAAVYGAFFRTSAGVMIEVAREPRHLGGLIGMVGVLQTWRRDLGYHVHIHYVVPGGALASDGTRWLPQRYGQWLLPEPLLAARFKERFRKELRRLGLLDQVDPSVWTRRKKWVVDCIPVGNGESALKYVAPYVHRVAISNSRIEQLEDGNVTYRFKDRDTGQWRHRTLPAEKFIACFLQHVLPKGFVKVRYYGFLTAKKRQALLPRIRTILGANGLASHIVPSQTSPRQPEEARRHCCPHCGKVLVLRQRLPRAWPEERAPPP